ncbi:hypothetical protein [Thermoflexus sp.]|uniref:hypothetical protein n=1 Tax=Thermoflexus sp. TaxID=1969742 RepID=UPI0035E46559
MLLVLGVLLAACAPPPGFQLPDDPLARILGRRVGRVIIVGSDGNLYLTDQSGLRQHALTEDAGPTAQGRRVYRLPAWSPDGRRLAVFEVFSGAVTRMRVIRIDLFPGRSPIRSVWGEWEGEEPAMLSWLDPQSLVVLSRKDARSTVYALWLLDPEGGHKTLLAQGSPLFFSWNAARRTLAWHREGRYLELRRLDEGEARQRSDHTAAFNAPAWSPDGRWLVWAEQEGSASALRLEETDDRATRTILTFTGGIAFAWSPASRYLALITDPTTTLPRIGPLELYDAETNTLTRLDEQSNLALFWSHDGRKLAAFRLLEMDPASGQVLLQARIYDLPGKKGRDLAAFIPTPSFLEVLALFDVFQPSASLWSPDDRFLLISAMEPEGKAGIYALHVSGWLEPRRLGDGVLAFWSPR